MTLEHYCTLFGNLRRAPGVVWTDTTKNRAPHKPLLLLAVLDLVGRSVITSRFISISGELTELTELFTDYWRSVMPVTQTSSIAFPFSHLHNEPFWKLIPLPTVTLTAPIINSITTVAQLRNIALGAEIDEELFVLMTAANGREALGATLLRSCFSEAGAQALRERWIIHKEAFQYSLVLEQTARAESIAASVVAEQYKPAARDQGFRRIVVMHYDHRCAFCGTRIVTSEGHTAVDAAHIVPWSQTRNDDIGNGLALCKLCHWAFDEGLLGVSDTYEVIVAKQLSLTHNAAGAILNLTGRNLLAPRDKAFWPHQANLGQHRNKWRL